MEAWALKDAEYERQQSEAEALDYELEKIADELITAVVNGEVYQGWTFTDVAGYLSEAGNMHLDLFLRQATFGVVDKQVRNAWEAHLDGAATECAEVIMRKGNEYR